MPCGQNKWTTLTSLFWLCPSAVRRRPPTLLVCPPKGRHRHSQAPDTWAVTSDTPGPSLLRLQSAAHLPCSSQPSTTHHQTPLDFTTVFLLPTQSDTSDHPICTAATHSLHLPYTSTDTPIAGHHLPTFVSTQQPATNRLDAIRPSAPPAFVDARFAAQTTLH